MALRTSFVIELYLGLLDWLFLLYVWTKAKLLSITLWSAYDHVKRFCDLTLSYNLVVYGVPNLFELCYFLAYKECFSI